MTDVSKVLAAMDNIQAQLDEVSHDDLKVITQGLIYSVRELTAAIAQIALACEYTPEGSDDES